jgi:hypothetical protein
MEMYIWIFVAYISGSALTYYLINNKESTETITESVIDTLIEQGYLKTRGSGKNLEILKHWEND